LFIFISFFGLQEGQSGVEFDVVFLEGDEIVALDVGLMALSHALFDLLQELFLGL
jgi:hypothetical protein